MKIILASGIFTPEIGGPAVYVPALADELVKLGHEITVITFSDQEKYDFDESLGYKIIRIKRKNKITNYFFYFMKMFKIGKNSDVIYSFDYFSAGIPTLISAKLLKKKLMQRNGGDLIWEKYLSQTGAELTLRDFYKLGLHKKNYLKFYIAKTVFRNIDRLIFSSKLQGELFHKYYGLDPDKIRYINNPIPAENYFKEKKESNKDIVWAGRMIFKNNLLRMVRVFCEIDQSDYKLVLIGEGDQKEKLVSYVKENNCEEKIIIKEKISREQIKDVISKSYGFVIPAFTDISPNTVLDCLSVCTPFIITKEHGYDWLRGKTIEFDPTDDSEMKKALSALMDKQVYNKILHNIGKINYDYSFAQAAEDTLKIIDELL